VAGGVETGGGAAVGWLGALLQADNSVSESKPANDSLTAVWNGLMGNFLILDGLLGLSLTRLVPDQLLRGTACHQTEAAVPDRAGLACRFQHSSSVN
jgi:hypothetical protein